MDHHRPLLVRVSGAKLTNDSDFLGVWRSVTPGECECGDDDCTKKQALESLPGDSLMRAAVQANEQLDDDAFGLLAMAEVEARAVVRKMALHAQVQGVREAFAEQFELPFPIDDDSDCDGAGW